MSNLLKINELAYGVKTVGMGLIPVSLMILLFEVFVNLDVKGINFYDASLREVYNSKMLIYYITFGCAHIIICLFVAFHFSAITAKDVPIIILKNISRVRIVILVFTFILVYAIDAAHLNLAFYSHDRLYLILTQSAAFKPMFLMFPSDFNANLSNIHLFYIFSIIPFTLICVALTVMVFGAFAICRDLCRYVAFEQIDVVKIKESIANINASIRNYAILLSVVMVSSTIATVLFFQLPVLLIEDETIRAIYNDESMSMGICWGVIFSLTLLFLCVFPFLVVHKNITKMIQLVRVQNNVELEQWISGHKSYYSFMWNLKFIVSILSPTAASILTTIVSAGLF